MVRNISFCLLLLIVLISCNTKTDVNLKIEPPFNNLDILSLSLKINPNNKQVARFENGVSIEIPKNAFKDIQGNIIKDDVTLSLKTFSSAAEIITSGIPMTYIDNETSGNFESAGMFQVSGKTSTSEVFIDKELTINYPSGIYGEYDFFQFEETNIDSIKSGEWKKLSEDKEPNKISESNLNTFQLNFATNDYPELLPLSTISWKLATTFCNPAIDENNWVLEQEWSSIEISEPKYGVGNTLKSSDINYDQYLKSGAILLTKDKSRIITSKKPITKIWSNKGELIKVIDEVDTDYSPVEILNDKFLIIERKNGDYIYNLKGDELGKLPQCHNRQLAHSKDIIVYNKNGTDPTVYLTTSTGKIIKAIKLKEDNSNLWQSGVYEYFILSPKDELITNSLDGIIIYDLNGQKKRQREGHFSSISYLKENTLMIEELDGSLTVWDYNTDKEVKSKKQFFNLKRKLIRNTLYSSYYFDVPNKPYVIINEPNADNSIIWNYENNEVDDLSFSIIYLEKDSLPNNLIVGYNSKDEIFHLYDIKAKRGILEIPNFGYNIYSDGSSYELNVSSDKSKLLINNNYHSRYYSITGDLIRDFKLYDSLISTSGFVKKDLIFTLSEDGIYRLWDKNGIELSSRKLSNSEQIYGWQNDNKIMTWNKIFRNYCYYDNSGNLIFNPSRTPINQFIDSTSIIQVDNEKKSMLLKSLFEIKPSVYQLTIRTENREFITYVYLNNNDIQKINKYYTERTKRINKELERQEEELKTLRRFKIKEFGIYNWDVIIKQSNYMNFAADFKFDVPTAFANINVFLITEFNGPVIVKFDRDSWSKFFINPDLPNKLLAVLPDNKVAIFNSFDSIDFDKVSIEKKYTFNMTIIDKPIEDLSDLEKILEK